MAGDKKQKTEWRIIHQDDRHEATICMKIMLCKRMNNDENFKQRVCVVNRKEYNNILNKLLHRLVECYIFTQKNSHIPFPFLYSITLGTLNLCKLISSYHITKISVADTIKFMIEHMKDMNKKKSAFWNSFAVMTNPESTVFLTHNMITSLSNKRCALFRIILLYCRP